jgi:hypothetical protein
MDHGEQQERDENHALHRAPPENGFGSHYTPAREILKADGLVGTHDPTAAGVHLRR